MLYSALLFVWILCSPGCSAQDPYATATPSATATPQPSATWSAMATPTPTPNPLAHTFWFHDSINVDNFLAGTPKGGISIGNYGLTKQAQADLAHSKGLSVLGGLTGSPGIYGPTGAQSITFLEHNNLDPLIAQKVDGLYVDEPMGQALNDPRECGPGCFTPGQPLTPQAANYIAATYNQLFAYLKAALPNAQVGICMSVINFHIMTINAGLKADFVCMESYGASTPMMLKQTKFQLSASRPNLKTMMLVYGSYPLCEQLHWGLGGINLVSLWNVDNYPPWIAGGGKVPAGPNEFDSNWMARATAYVNGDTSFCPTLLTKPSTDPYK